MGTHYLGAHKVIEDLSSEEDEKQRQYQTRKELTLVAQKAAQFYEKYVKNYKCVTTEMCSLSKDQQCFLVILLPLPHPIQKLHIYNGDNRLGLRLAIAGYHMAEPKPKISVLSRRYSISCCSSRRYTGKVMMSHSQYK